MNIKILQKTIETQTKNLFIQNRFLSIIAKCTDFCIDLHKKCTDFAICSVGGIVDHMNKTILLEMMRTFELKRRVYRNEEVVVLDSFKFV